MSPLPGLLILFALFPRLIPTGIYTVGYDIKTPLLLELLFFNVNMGSFDAYLQSPSGKSFRKQRKM